MKYKRNGFTYIECIVSLSIIFIGVSLINVSLYSNYNLTNNNVIYKKMVNEAKSIIEEKKYEIVTSKAEDVLDSYEVKESEEYKIFTKIEKDKKYYQCYKIDVRVTSENKNIEMVSYVTQQ